MSDYCEKYVTAFCGEIFHKIKGNFFGENARFGISIAISVWILKNRWLASHCKMSYRLGLIYETESQL